MRVILANQNRGNILNLMNNNICIIALSLWNIEENFLLREIACLYPFCSTHFCFMVISCFTCINYLNMRSIIKKAKRTFALDIMFQTNLLEYLKSYFFHNLEIGLPSCTQGRLFTKLYKSSTTKTAQRLSLQQLIAITTWQVIRLIHLMSQLTIIRAVHQFCLSYHALDHCTFP